MSITEIKQAENRAIEATRQELLNSSYTADEIDMWFNTPVINGQTPLELIREGCGRFLIPYVRQLVEARKPNA